MQKPETIVINYFRPPDREMKIPARLLYRDDDVIVTSHTLWGASKPLVIEGETVIENGYRAVFVEYIKEYFDVAMIFRPDGTFTGYYADINTPSRVADDGYWTKDLFLDLWVSADKSRITVLDEDEFQEAMDKNWISKEEAQMARAELERLIDMYNHGSFPPELLEAFR